MSEYPPNDQEFRDGMVAEVKGGAFHLDDCTWLGFPEEFEPAPKAGDHYRIYSKGLGFSVRGLFFNGKKVYYRTEEQQKEHHQREIDAQHAEQIAKFEENRAEMDAKFDALPFIFQKRIEKFRRNNPDFRWKYEGYEMFVCGEAVRMAEELETPDAIQEFSQLSCDEQAEKFVMDPNHSGNTFSAAVRLAYLFLTQESAVEQMPGAMEPLVGSANDPLITGGRR